MLDETCPQVFGLIYIFVTFILCVSFNIQIGKINTLLIDSQPQRAYKKGSHNKTLQSVVSSSSGFHEAEV